jgi:hypothetical protein
MHSEYYDNTNRGDDVLTCWRRLIVVILTLTHFQVYLSKNLSATHFRAQQTNTMVAPVLATFAASVFTLSTIE